jgi:hypothetical protein
VTKALERKSSKRKATIVFSSSTGGSFTCAVDIKRAVPCTSPFTRKYKYGTHAVVVTAINPVGFPDPTPAIVTFKVTRPRH